MAYSTHLGLVSVSSSLFFAWQSRNQDDPWLLERYRALVADPNPDSAREADALKRWMDKALLAGDPELAGTGIVVFHGKIL